MTKKQAARERKAAWNQAIREGRAVNFAGEIFKAYPTPELAQMASAAAQADGLKAFVIPPSLAIN